MNNKKLLLIVLLVSILSFNKVFAQDVCSKSGYTILTINGIFTDEKGALLNKGKLKQNLPSSYKNEPINVDYVYNATHLAGFGDLVDAARQGLFSSSSDYDLVEMLDSASQKVKTQKLLLVGHSQGNFYANSFYDRVVDKNGGVPATSLGVYSVATPDNHVSGGGKYLTSDTDSVISSVVGNLKKILKPNDHISLQKTDGNGHSFSDVYLKYRNTKIVSDIKSSFDKLQVNDIQNTGSSCISPQKISTLHKITGTVISASDFIVDVGVKSSAFVYNSVKDTTTSLANTLAKVAKKSFALVGLVDDNNEIASTEIVEPVLNNETTLEYPPSVVVEPKEKETVITKEDNKIDTPVLVENEIQDILQDIKVDAEINNTTTSEITPTILPTYSGGGGGTSSVNTSEDVNKEQVEIEIPNPIHEENNLDITAPVITLEGESIINIDINGVYTEKGATALDGKDGNVTVSIGGSVDTTKLGTTIITYTAKDLALNTSTLTRTVNVIGTKSKTSTLIFPRSGIFKDDGLDISSGKKDTTLFTFQVIYRDAENNPPSSLKLHIKDILKGIYLPDVDMVPIERGTDELSDGNYENGELFTFKSTYDEGYYFYSIRLLDRDGNFFNINEDNSSLYFRVTPYDHFYIPKYTFGHGNGDGNYWQTWIFNGSSIYDWRDSYVNNYLHEQFKIEVETGGFWCSNCLQRGVFTRDPQKGFDTKDLKTSSLENNPQNNSSGNTYDVDIQWDSTGYTTNIFLNNTTFYNSHTNVSGVNSDMWVGWDGTSNGFKDFPAGSWVGFWGRSEKGLMGGQNMILTPYPVYNINEENTDPDTEEDDTIPVISSGNIITSFSFEGLDPKVTAVAINDNVFIAEVPYGTDVKNLIPTISISDKATITPASLTPQDFSESNVGYIVKAEDGSTHPYAVIVRVLPMVIIKSSEKLITSFSFDSLNPKVDGIIDNVDHKINLTLPYDTDTTDISPTISISDKANIDNLGMKDFRNPIVYTVTAEDGSTISYIVTVVVSPNPNPVIEPDTTLPTILGYTLNGAPGGVAANPIQNNMNIVINSSKNVNWMSIKIENVIEPSSYKIFQSDSLGCKDGTNSCSKIWDGTLSSGGLLKNGEYKIKVHMKDEVPNYYNDYLPMIIDVIGQS